MDDSEFPFEDRAIKQEVEDEEETSAPNTADDGGERFAGDATPEEEHLQQDSSTLAGEKEEDAETNGDSNNGLSARVSENIE